MPIAVELSMIDGVPARACRECGVVKPVSEYYRAPKGPLGRMARCKPCYTAYKVSRPGYYEKLRARHHADRERSNQRSRDWHAANREKSRARSAEFRRHNPDYMDQWSRKNPGYTREWRAANRDRALQVKHHRRARRAGLPRERYTLTEIVNRDGLTCYLCGQDVDLDTSGAMGASIDHLIPFAVEYPDHPGDIAVNVAVTHMRCNAGKRNKLLAEAVARYELNCQAAAA